MFLLVIHLLCLLASVRALNESSAPAFPAVFGFGDSIIDTGNNNLLLTSAKCNFPPYGKDFIDHKPTGRFSNGKVPVDMIVSGLGIKELLPAYLSLNMRNEDLLTGVCFASGGSGFDPLTPALVSAFSLKDQLELFKEYKDKLRVIAGDERAAHIISESLYVVVQGSNDVANTYFGTILRRLDYDFPTYSKFLVGYATSFLEELYNLGARKIAVVGLPPLGCLPSQRTVAGGIQRDCVASYNQAAETFNNDLSNGINQVLDKHVRLKIIYVDIYERLLYVIQHYVDYGFIESTKGCCGTGEFEAAILCNSISSKTCLDDSKYVFWDSYHPTEKTYAIVVEKIFQNDLPRLL